jgi:hypothetical protein
MAARMLAKKGKEVEAGDSTEGTEHAYERIKKQLIEGTSGLIKLLRNQARNVVAQQRQLRRRMSPSMMRHLDGGEGGQ